MSKLNLPGGVWSATPTPLTADYRVDVDSVPRLVRHHLDMDVVGVMLAGTCGEGAWLTESQKETLTRATVEAAEGKLHVAVQVTDNSAARTLDNIEKAAAWGAEIAVVAGPFGFINPTPDRMLKHFTEIARKSVLPIGYYELGGKRGYAVPESHLAELVTEPNIVMIKDSSTSDARRDIFVAARKKRPGLVVLDGDEFNVIPYIQAGYDGVMLGGSIFNASRAGRIVKAARAGNIAEAEKLQARMNDLMYRVYGGPKIECWMEGLKELLVQMGIFSTRTNLFGFPLTDSCRAQITAAVNGSDGLGYQADLLGKAAVLAK
jgi:4-hydroxy-tetrahydrodipicolinate synthase